MISTAIQFSYTVFGLRLKSEFILPELLQSAKQEEESDFEIRSGDLSDAWDEYGSHDEYFAFAGNHILFYIPDIAIFKISGGKQIIVSPLSGADEKSIRLYLLGTCIGTILLQRRLLPLHGSAVVINGKAYAFVGESGAGKSTLAAAFLNRGYQLLSDDVIAVSHNQGDNIPVVLPAYPQQKLWQESIEQLGMDTNRYLPIYESKYAIPVSSMFCTESVPLAGVFELVKTEEKEVEIRRYQGLERLPILRMHTYRDFLIPQLCGEQWHFSTIASLVSKVNVYQLRRPSVGFTAHDLVAEVLQTVNEAVVS